MSTTGIVASGTGGVWRVLRADGSELEASMRGRLKKSDTGRRAGGSIRRDTVAAAASTAKLAVGDRVTLEHDEHAKAWVISEILPRASRLARVSTLSTGNTTAFEVKRVTRAVTVPPPGARPRCVR